MKLSECFVGIQGEGSTAGQPRLFIRTSGCTLKCSFCDTKYHIKGKEMTEKEQQMLKKNKKWCITGGEPLIQQREIVRLIKLYKPEWVEVETNGTVLLELETLQLINQFNVSPKEKRFQPKNLNPNPELLDSPMRSASFIAKFVYSDKKSERFITNTVKRFMIPTEKVWIMPEGISKKQIEKKEKEVWNYCLKKGYNYSPRLQVTLYGKKKGI